MTDFPKRRKSSRIRSRWRFCVQALIALVVIGILLAPPSLVAQADSSKAAPRAPAYLLELAALYPDQTFRVIVQRRIAENIPEKALERMGGRRKGELPLITGFAMEIPGRAIPRLASSPGVRYVSLDAPLISANTGLYKLSDEFSSISYGGNNGTLSWASGWTEVKETTSPTGGYMRVISSNACAGGAGNCLRIDTAYANYEVYRQADLTASARATLSLYRNNALNLSSGTSEAVQLQVSPDGGSTWITLQTYSSTANLGAATDSFDITPYATGSTRIRFIVTGVQATTRYIYFDNIKIEHVQVSEYESAVLADQLRAATGLTGQGVTVAVVDSGIANHADFQDGSGSHIVVSSPFSDLSTADDQNGHGSHVAGILAGNGSSSNGFYEGIAPGANLINLRILNQYGLTFTSELINALEWIYNNKDVYNIRVVNLSVNSGVLESYHSNPLNAAVEILWFSGIVVVVSAGNNAAFTGPNVLFPPANDPFVITVGAAEDHGTAGLDDDSLASFSAYGQTVDGFSKPDLVAPGRDIAAVLASPNAFLYNAYPLHRLDSNYFRMSGTSMSTPMVSGAVALLLQDEPYLTPDQVKFRLMATANANWAGYDQAKAGAGYLDVYAAVFGSTTESANQRLAASQLLWTGEDPVVWDSVAWNSVAWNSVAWNSVAWNSVAWNSVAWNSVAWNSAVWDTE